MGDPTLSFSDLPDELHLRILHFAGWRSAINLGKTSRKFRDICEEPTLWHKAVKNVFHMHLDNFNHNGNWKQEFRTLVTGKFYGWGKNSNLMFNTPVNERPVGRDARSSPWPRQFEGQQFQSVVDIQSGGWSVALLTLSGSVIIGGVLDGISSFVTRTNKTLRFPTDTVIYKISCGRSHLLALSDQGEVWTAPGGRSGEQPTLVRFIGRDTVLDYPGNRLEDSKHGAVKKIVAGWEASGVLIHGYGISIWFNDRSVETSNTDPSYAREVSLHDIPYLSSTGTLPAGVSSDIYANDPVVDFTIGESFLVAVTSSGKVYAMDFVNIQTGSGDAPMQLLNFSAPKGQPPINRVEGKFCRFGFFNKNGLVHLTNASDLESARSITLAASRNHCRDLEMMRTDTVIPEVVEELDNHNIIDVAFGDWHNLALTDTGKVLSWGIESQGCGSLGLGPRDIAATRGVKYGYQDGILKTPQIISFKNRHAEEANESDGTMEYAYKISAAGWHSCALIAVVNKDSTLSAGGISQTVDGGPEKKSDHPKPNYTDSITAPNNQPQSDPKGLAPQTERGHQSGAMGTESEGMEGRADLVIARGPHFEMSSQARPDPKSIVPKSEKGHRGGIFGMQSDARGMQGGLAEGTIAKGGKSLFGMTGGVLPTVDDQPSDSKGK